MEYKSDTVCAISTPPGISGIAVIRVSGMNAIPVVNKIFRSRKSLDQIEPRKVTFGKIYDKDLLVDDVLVTVFPSPHSYTGEDVVEISSHGNTFITNRILELLLRSCRLAEPGEFTQRAFLNDKIGLTQAEAVGDLLNAKTRYSHLAALKQLEGSLRHRIESLLGNITGLRIKLELEIDFMEQGLGQLNKIDFLTNLEKIKVDLIDLTGSGSEGLILKDGLRISLVGAPNVGKSSIFNAFLETERAIVTPHPGTTRDYLEEAISLQGYLVRIFDTAGIRDTENDIEKIGIERSFEIIGNSHKVLFIIDGEENLTEYKKLIGIVPKKHVIKIINKSDQLKPELIQDFRKKGYIPCSAVKPEGLRKLKEMILSEIRISEEKLDSGILTNTRQIAAATRALDSIEKALNSFKQDMGYEFTAFDLKEASGALEEIIGKITTDDVLNRIFENFCVGK